ncbi:BlaI/MecI/CopY family transcriptional regulator [Flavilitoribacter nigricans]|uniref:Penicillinase repressor n=1 Tax=Flavilitoribacter nigricans (strain ATCC 23147 / DSM 23189 / NBRC 102662 / NCIMB 1420 / SS-2) TaxID=1122177 RepID=A0A2D0N5F2_FLAN2|nr:BlaI/MecI/CopY family transcriptional regulator [Flavilitoribacter nigricans]PHN03741.1 penicillinase repressor [Flavilitoribacter nigricans DSM 23189 = NBRC 102662]
MELSKAEKKLMQLLWKMKRAYMKDILEAYPEPKPAPTTVATLLKRMTDKGFISYEKRGSVREYYPLVNKAVYFKKQLGEMISNYFDGSPTEFASFFAESAEMSQKELETLREIIDQQLKNREE